MSVTIEGNSVPAGFIEPILERAADHPEEFGLSHVVGDTNFTWDEVARVVDHEGVADGVIDNRDLDAFVDHGRTSRGAFQRLVASMGNGMLGRIGSIRLDSGLVADSVVATEPRCQRLERAAVLMGTLLLDGAGGEAGLSNALGSGFEYLVSGCLFE